MFSFGGGYYGLYRWLVDLVSGDPGPDSLFVKDVTIAQAHVNGISLIGGRVDTITLSGGYLSDITLRE